ncbi:MAG TPA: hypothetical protein VGU25_07755 [Acidobacteriaceae bacterium]|nr:hypothetical protein [Acidobacteriaceae bacterium]
MLPRDLGSVDFRSYPPQARQLAIENISILRRLPLGLLSSLLAELIEYDFKFPAERTRLSRELASLGALTDAQLSELLKGFFKISLTSQLENLNWVNSPAQFVEQLSAHLWRTGQQDAFSIAAVKYDDHLTATTAAQAPPIPRLGIVIIGRGVASYDGQLFRRLRPYATYFSRVRPENGLRLLLDAIASRAEAHPAAYAHWYIDGGEPENHDSRLTAISWAALAPVRTALLGHIHSEIERPGMGPEKLRSIMARTTPSELGMKTAAGDEVLQRFQLRLLTEGSGTQLFSTSFAQWGAREALRRAQPITLLVRFAPRQRLKPMNELLSAQSGAPETDPLGSLIDADMAAWYTWLDQQRLPGADRSCFLVWFEAQRLALAISPQLPRGTESSSEVGLEKLLAWMT